MKHLAIVLFLSLSLLQHIAAQPLWSRIQYDWGGNKRDYLANILPLPGRQYLVGGTSQSDPYCTKSSICYGGDDMAIFVLDNTIGNKIWEKSYGGTGSDKLWDVQHVPAGGFILVGETTSGPSGIKTSSTFGKEDIWVVRVDDAGNLLWEKTFGSAESERALKVIPTSDGGFLIAGTYASGMFNYMDYRIMKIDAAGNSSWSRDYSGSKDDILQDMVLMPNGNILLSGCSNSPSGGGKTAPQIGSYDQWLICVDPTGFPLWEKTYGGIGSENVCTLLALNDGNYLIVGEENTGALGTLRKIDPQGNILWSKSCGPGLFRRASQAANGKIYVAGESFAGVQGCKTSPLTGGKPDYWITVYDAAGNKIDDMDYGGSEDDYLISDIRVIDRDVFVLGQTNSNYSGNKITFACGGSDGWLIQLSPGLNIHPPTPVALCNNNIRFRVDMTTLITYRPDNVFTAQLSDINGSFSTYTNIGSMINTSSTGIDVILPSGLPASDNYKLRVVSSSFADTSNAYPITYQRAPQVFLGNDTTVCGNISHTLTTGAQSAGSTYLWNDGSTGSTLTVTAAGTYSCSVQNTCGTANDAIQISVKTGTVADIGNDRNFCEGNTISLQSTPQAADVKYLWNNGAVTPDITIKTGGAYWLHTTNACGTTGDTILVTMDPRPVSNFNKDSVLCFGTSRTFDAEAGHANYLWYDGQGGETRTVSQPGEYWVQITGNNGCITRDTANIKRIAPLPAGFLPADTVLCTYEDLILKPKIKFNQFEWSTGDDRSFIQVNNPGLYWLIGTDRYGCIGKDSIQIGQKQCPYGFFMPSGFSPNRDGKNDWCRPRLFGKIVKYHFTMYNRWGQKVFDSYDHTKGWDGYINGRPADIGTYVWSCVYQLNSEAEKRMKGTVVLVR